MYTSYPWELVCDSDLFRIFFIFFTSLRATSNKDDVSASGETGASKPPMEEVMLDIRDNDMLFTE